MRKSSQTSARPQQPDELIERHFTGLIDRSHLQHDALLLTQKLPGHDIRVMFEEGEQHLIAFVQKCFAKAGGHKVNRICRPAREDDLVLVTGVEEGLNLAPRLIVEFGCALTQNVESAMKTGR